MAWAFNPFTGTFDYTASLSGYVPTTRTLTINGTAFDLSADRSWTIAADQSFGTTTQIPYMNVGGTDFLYSAALTFDGTTFKADAAAIFNEAGADADFRVEGDTDANAFIVDASTDSIGIGIAAPLGKLHTYRYLSTRAANTYHQKAQEYVDWAGAVSNCWYLDCDITDYRRLNSGATDHVYGLDLTYTRNAAAVLSTAVNSYVDVFPMALVDNASFTATDHSYLNHRCGYAQLTQSYTVNLTAGKNLRYIGVAYDTFLNSDAPTLTSGNLNAYYYAFRAAGTGHTTGTHKGKAFYNSLTGFDELYCFYNDTASPNLLGLDSSITNFGTGVDAGIYYDGTNLIVNPRIVGTGVLSVLGTISPDLTTLAAGYVDDRALALTVTGGTILYSYPRLTGSYTAGTFATTFGADFGYQDERTLNSSALMSATETGYGVRLSINRSNSFVGKVNSYTLYGFWSVLVDSASYQTPTTTIGKNSTMTYRVSGGTATFGPTIAMDTAARTIAYTVYGTDMTVTYQPTITTGAVTSKVYGMKYAISSNAATGSKAMDMKGFWTTLTNAKVTDIDDGSSLTNINYGLDLTVTKTGAYTGDEGYMTCENIGGLAAVAVSGTYTMLGNIDQNNFGFDFQVATTTIANNADLTYTVFNYGVRGYVNPGEIETAGTVYSVSYGGYFGLSAIGAEPSNGYRNLYGLYIDMNSMSGVTEAWGIYCATVDGCNNYLGPDNVITYLGSGKNAGCFYDGTDWWNQPAIVGLGKWKVGDGTNSTNFDSTGHQTMTGTAKPWEDLRIEPVARTTGTGAPAFEKYFDDSAGTSVGVYLYSFTDESVAGNEKQVFFTMQMPHQWDAGPISIHVHWTPYESENAVDVLWGLEYCWKEIGATYGDTTIVTASTTFVPDDANLVAGKHYLAEFADLTPDSTQDGLSSILIGRLFRNSSAAADTCTKKVGLLYIDAHYQINSIGSTDEYTK